MKPALIDTDILSLFFRGQPDVVNNFRQNLSQYNEIAFSILSYYEILSGLKHRDAKKQLDRFEEFAAQNIILPLTERSIFISADIYADTRKKGTPVDDVDILIAGVAIANNHILVTHNRTTL
jgi:tRNA(fMet)-specific endonuclease VapC